MKLLQVPTVELEARIKQELESNPRHLKKELKKLRETILDDEGEKDEALDEFDFDEYLDDETPDYKTSVRNHGSDVEDKDIPLGAGSTFRERLISQLGLHTLNIEQRALGEHLIGQLDEAGYLRRDLDSIVNDLAFTQNLMIERSQLEEVLRVVQTLDPALGATTLQECLLLQIERKLQTVKDDGREQSMQLARRILNGHFEAFTKKHYSQILQKLEVEEEQLKSALEEVTKLNPKPGNSGGDSSRPVQHVVPDFILRIRDDEVVVNLNHRNAPELRISPSYKR